MNLPEELAFNVSTRNQTMKSDNQDVRQSIVNLFGDKLSWMNSGFETATSWEKKMMMQRTLNQLKPNFELSSKRESEVPRLMDHLILSCNKCGAKFDP